MPALCSFGIAIAVCSKPQLPSRMRARQRVRHLEENGLVGRLGVDFNALEHITASVTLSAATMAAFLNFADSMRSDVLTLVTPRRIPDRSISSTPLMAEFCGTR